MKSNRTIIESILMFLGILGVFHILTPTMLLAADYSGNITNGIYETVGESGDLHVTYKGGTLSSDYGNSMSLAGDSNAGGNIHIGYNPDGTEAPLTGTILDSTSNSSAIAVTHKGSGSIRLLSAASINCTYSAINISALNDVFIDNRGAIHSIGFDEKAAVCVKTDSMGSVNFLNSSRITSSGNMVADFSSAKGMISFVNSQDGILSGRIQGARLVSDSGAIVFDNSGLIESSAGGGAYISTAATVDIVNRGGILASSSSYGIYVGSEVSGGTVRNSGVITAGEAITIMGGNLRVELESAGQLNGNVYLNGGKNNTLAIGSGTHHIGGSMEISHSRLEIAISGSSDFGSIVSDGVIAIEGAELYINICADGFAIGDSFLILKSDAGIVGSFSGIDENSICRFRDSSFEYAFLLEQTLNEVYLHVVSVIEIPELPFTSFLFALLAIAGAFADKMRIRRL